MPFPDELNDSFEHVADLGSGAILETYRVRSRDSGQDLVLRLLAPNLRNDIDLGGNFKRFFSRYASLLRNSHIAKGQGLRTTAGLSFAVEEFVPWRPLNRDLLCSISQDEALRILGEICHGLHLAHQRNVYHLCLAPEHILTDGKRSAKIVGFGAAVYVGTPYLEKLPEYYRKFMAPEILEGGPPRPESDVLSLATLVASLFPELRQENDLKKNLAIDPGKRSARILGFESVLRDMIASVGPLGRDPTITITSLPFGATIRDRASGTLVANLSDADGTPLPYDPKRDLWIEKDGFTPQRINWADITDDFTLHVELTPEPLPPPKAPVIILTEPETANIEVDAQPCEVHHGCGNPLQLPYGKHEIRVSKAGYREKAVHVNIADSLETFIGPVRLEPAPFKLFSDPPGATVRTDNEDIGTTGPKGLEVPWERGPLTVEKPGYEKLVKEFTSPPEQDSVTVSLKRTEVRKGILGKCWRRLYPPQYQPDRPDILWNTEWGRPKDDLSKDEAKKSGLVLYRKRWVDKQQRRQLRRQLWTYRFIRVSAIALHIPAVFSYVLFARILPGIDGHVAGLVVFMILAFCSTRLWRFRPWARVIAGTVWSLFLIVVVLVTISLTNEALPLALACMLAWLLLVYAPLCTRTARAIFSIPDEQAGTEDEAK